MYVRLEKKKTKHHIHFEKQGRALPLKIDNYSMPMQFTLMYVK